MANLPQVIARGRAINERLLAHEQASANCLKDTETLDQMFVPSSHVGGRASALSFGQPRAMALLRAICLLALGALAPSGFRARDLRAAVLGLLGTDAYTATQATYDLRRLRLKGVIERIPRSQRYRVTEGGLSTSLAVIKLYQRVLGPAVSRYRGQPTTARIDRASRSVEHYLAALFEIA